MNAENSTPPRQTTRQLGVGKVVRMDQIRQPDVIDQIKSAEEERANNSASESVQCGQVVPRRRYFQNISNAQAKRHVNAPQFVCVAEYPEIAPSTLKIHLSLYFPRQRNFTLMWFNQQHPTTAHRIGQGRPNEVLSAKVPKGKNHSERA